MKNYLLLAIVFLFTCAGYGKDHTTKSPILTYQSNSYSSANHFSDRESQERSYIDTSDDQQKTTSKPEKKRHLFAKTVLGLAGTFVVVVMIVWAIYGGPEFKY